MENKDGRRWWNKLMGHDPVVTEGEQVTMVGDKEQWLSSQEHKDARRLIEIGSRTNDIEMVKIGQAKMRYLLGRETPDDEELFNK
jgi:hypothetical protein